MTRECPVCSNRVTLGEHKEYPFCSGRCREKDLFGWFVGDRGLTTPLEDADEFLEDLKGDVGY